MISTATAITMVRKGYEAYLAYVIDTVKARPSVSNIPTVSDFPNLFPEEFPGLPPEREIEFAIDIVLGATPASVTPQNRGSVDNPSTRGILMDVGLPDTTHENRAKSPLYGELYPRYNLSQ